MELTFRSESGAPFSLGQVWLYREFVEGLDKREAVYKKLILMGPFIETMQEGYMVQSHTLDSRDSQGAYFAKKEFIPDHQPGFEQTRALLPGPVFDENPGYVEMYWKAWELAFRNFHTPAPGSGFVSPFIDAAFNANIFLWDTCFMTMFCNVAHPLVPGIGSLDNFYAKQHADGEICREINRTTGKDFAAWVNARGDPLYSAWGYSSAGTGRRDGDGSVKYLGRTAPAIPPRLTLDALNHPILAWAEMESYRVTGDKARLQLICPALVKYYEALQVYLRQGNGLYMTDWASMDNSTRNPYLVGGGCGVDMSCEMALIAREMAAMARALGRDADSSSLDAEADELTKIINRLMWDPETRFYYDLTLAGERIPIKTVAAFWALLAGVASAEQAEALAAELRNPETFGRLHPVPTLAADQKGYNPRGGYWCGSSWAPTTTMAVRGLERNGMTEQARSIACQDLDVTWQVFRKTGMLWENYAPDAVSEGDMAKADLVGWTGIAPILYLLEFGVGLKPDAPRNELTWTLRGRKRVGCERYRFNGRVVDLVAAPENDGAGWQLAIRSSAPFRLNVKLGNREERVDVGAGETRARVQAGGEHT